MMRDEGRIECAQKARVIRKDDKKMQSTIIPRNKAEH